MKIRVILNDDGDSFDEFDTISRAKEFIKNTLLDNYDSVRHVGIYDGDKEILPLNWDICVEINMPEPHTISKVMFFLGEEQEENKD